MTRIACPANICDQIAAKAVQEARQNLQGRGWTSARSLREYSSQGLAGIQTSAKYLMYQERGIRPFLMRWKRDPVTVAMGAKSGGTHFRVHRNAVVGTPGYVDIPDQGRVFRKQRWRHPGLKPQNFMHEAIKNAIRDSHATIKHDIMRALRGEY